MNTTNQSVNQNVSPSESTDPWVESGAMVYVALTVATLSAVIMCCVWFVKQRLSTARQYGTVSSGEEQVELNTTVTRESSGSEEEISLEPDPTTFRISESDSDEDNEEHAV